jgi:hypothetical protein
VLEPVTAGGVRAPPASPFKGLSNFTEDDAAFFFGREREREVIIANLKARPLTLLYGESGVGKSSLLRAGVTARLLELARENYDDLGTPEFVPVMFSAWRDDPVRGLTDAVRASVAQFTGAPAQPAESADPVSEDGLAEVIQRAAGAADAYLLLILDQFEEFFLYHPADEGPEGFAVEFARAVNRDGLQGGFIVSIREDALAKLDRFERSIPRLFDSYLRVRHLDVATAREAILRPVERYNELVGGDRRMEIEPALVDAVVEQVRTGRVVLEQAGQGALDASGGADGAGDRVETPYLQLVMARLWEAEHAEGSVGLRLSTLERLGGAQQIVRTHLDAALANLSPRERDTATEVFHHLVTPSGTKIALAASDLAEYVHRPEREVEALLETLAAGETRIVRPVPPPPGDDGPSRFEIFHDVLAPSILDWRTRQIAARASRVALRRVIAVAGLIVVAIVVVVVLSAKHQRDEARRDEARLKAALAGEVARFRPTVSWLASTRPGSTTLQEATVKLEPGVSARVRCDGCRPFDVTGRKGEESIPVPAIVGRRFRPGEEIRLLFTRGNVGRTSVMSIRSRRLPLVRGTLCRPDGSLVSPRTVPAICPTLE